MEKQRGQQADSTTSALLEQLIYIDNFMNNALGSEGLMTPNLDMDGQLSLDLAAFADDSFIFLDEDKSDFKNGDIQGDGDHQDDSGSLWKDISVGGEFLEPNVNSQHNHENSINHDVVKELVDINNLPKWPVPPGAKHLLESAGLSESQIDLLSALVAQHQKELSGSLTNSAPTPSTTTSSMLGSQDMGSGSIDAEVDKRRRNTAASARFRIKKKLKEKQMENRIISLNDTIKNLEIKLLQLELENRLLKNLVIEKGTQKSEDELVALKEKAKR